VTEAAALAGVSTTTLRHYDSIGLLKPRARSNSGIRLYGREELLRLREILVWRQLGFPLADVAALVDDPDHDRAEALRRQRQLVKDQHGRFETMLQGLDEAIAAIEEGRSLVDHEVFQGFDISLSTDELERDAVTSKLRLVDGPTRISRRAVPSVSDIPSRRIVATDPIRIAEDLLALGVMPAGTGTFIDNVTGESFWPWPDSVEGPIRERIMDLGCYGTSKERIAQAQPDLIIDLHFSETGQTGSEDKTDGMLTYSDLCALAPTVLVEAPINPPGFVGRLRALATAVSAEQRVDPLLATWSARTRALREHVAGESVSALVAGEPDFDDAGTDVNLGCVPNAEHEAQLFSALGLDLLPAPEGRLTHWGGAVLVTSATVRCLEGRTLFLSACGQASVERFNALLKTATLRRLPAVRSGRVFDLRWTHMRSGWFSAHAQLDVIARAFGVCRLRTAGSGPPIHLAVARSGKVTVAPTAAGAGIVTLGGPKISDTPLELTDGDASSVDIGDVGAADLSVYPEAYWLATRDRVTHPLTHDRESALERVTQRRAA
jgi:DNA-binding transcriptional MerR regulator/ABC-type Fe3+-hydroxamate transport system substrate-binding protein